MTTGRFIAYYRVSTATQGRSGLGVEAQQAAVHAFLNGGNWKLLGEFTEIESGANNARPELEKALNACRLKGATLVIAKLDRLSRDAHFLLGLDKAGVDFVAADLPAANRMTVGHYGRCRGGGAPHDLSPHEGSPGSGKGAWNSPRGLEGRPEGGRQVGCSGQQGDG